MIPFEYPLEENKDQNDHNLLIWGVEQNAQDIRDQKKKLDRAIRALMDYEIRYYGEE